MKFYHATSEESATALMSQGANKELAGLNAGTQAGKGFYLATTLVEARYWAEKLFNAQVSICAVSVENARIASLKDQENMDTAFRAWLVASDYGTIEDDCFSATDKAYAAHGIDADEPNPIKRIGLVSTLFGLYLQSLGYDGYVVPGEYDDTVIILNFALLSANAFSFAESYMPSVWR